MDRKRARRSDMKVLHLPTAVGGNAAGLARGERSLGLDSRVLVKYGSWLNYPCDINLAWETKGLAARLLDALRVFYGVRKEYDAFHFNFGSSLIDVPEYGLPLMELPFYPKGKRLVFTYNGCDARQKLKTLSRTGFSPCHDESCYNGVCNDKRLDRRKEKKIAKAARFAGHVFALNPDLLWVLPEGSTFLPYTVAAWDSIQPAPYSPDAKIRIVHAPTDRAAKGSAHIIRAVEELTKRFANIEFILVENMPNKEAVEVYRRAHIVIDQVLAGWYGAFAVEAMKMGKPVAVFLREEDLKFLPPGMARDLKNAVINVNPFNIVETLGAYLENPLLLKEKSMAAVEYVHRWHDPRYVAGITKRVYEGAGARDLP